MSDTTTEKKWCAYCGAWGDHQSGYCVQMLRDREKVLNDENIRLRRLLEKQHDILCQHGLEEYGN
jgi:hypothetical protein